VPSRINNDVAQRPHLIRGIEQPANRPLQEGGDPPALDRKRREPEQRIEERDQQRKRVSVERGADEIEEDVPRHAPRVRPQESA